MNGVFFTIVVVGLIIIIAPTINTIAQANTPQHLLPLPILFLLPLSHLFNRPPQKRFPILLHPPLHLLYRQGLLLIAIHDIIAQHAYISLPLPRAISVILLKEDIGHVVVLVDGLDGGEEVGEVFL